MNYVRLPLSFVLYLIYRVVRAYECKRVLMDFGPLALDYYKQTTPNTFAEFTHGR